MYGPLHRVYKGEQGVCKGSPFSGPIIRDDVSTLKNVGFHAADEALTRAAHDRGMYVLIVLGSVFLARSFPP